MEKVRIETVQKYQELRDHGAGHKEALLAAARHAGVSTRSVMRWKARRFGDNLSSLS